MKLDLLSHLESYGNKDWLEHYSIKNSKIDLKKDSGRHLVRLTKSRIEQISTKNSGGDRLQIIVAESEPIEFLAAFLAAVITEVDVFLCDPNWQEQEWQQVANLVRSDFIFGRQETKSIITETRPKNYYLALQKPNNIRQSLIMIPTGGSSGKIKFAMHDWLTLSSSVKGFQTYFDCRKINSFCTLPLYHVSGLMQFLRSFMTEGELIVCPYRVIKTKPIIFDRQGFFISLVPTQLELLIQLLPTWLAQFKTVLIGGAPPRLSLLNEARKYKIPIATTYGMTETASQVVTLKPKDFLSNNNSSGRVLPHARITIKPEGDRSIDGKIGIINISCSSLCLGYYPQVFERSDVFTTDDLGYFDDRGYLYLVGRNSQKIITGGENVFPAEVEEVILATKLVKDVCVVGISDRVWGQAVTAIYVPIEKQFDLDLTKIKMKTQLARYKQPKNWIQVDSLPRNNRGKINYQKVKAIAKQVISNK